MMVEKNWIKQIVNEFDVGCMLRFPVMASYEHEYEYEINFIFDYLSVNNQPTDSELASIIINAFARRFCDNPKSFDSLEMARQILKISNKIICLVCHESYFEDRHEDWMMCNSCSWEYDFAQAEDWTLEDTPNQSCVLERQLYRILLHGNNTRHGLHKAREHYGELIKDFDHYTQSFDEFLELGHVFIQDMLGVYYDAYAHLDSKLCREDYIRVTYEKMMNYKSY